MQIIENKRQRHESMASFCPVFCHYQATGAQFRQATWGILAG
jgi:hypothetical protein